MSQQNFLPVGDNELSNRKAPSAMCFPCIYAHLLSEIMNLMYFTGFFFLILFSLTRINCQLQFPLIYLFTFKKCFTLAVSLKSWENTKQIEKKSTDGQKWIISFQRLYSSTCLSKIISVICFTILKWKHFWFGKHNIRHTQ